MITITKNASPNELEKVALSHDTENPPNKEHQEKGSSENEKALIEVSLDGLEKGQIGSSASSASNKASASSSSGISGGGGPRRMQEVSLETAEDLDTLDEPVWDTVKRDLKAVSAKFGQVLLPRADRQKLLRDWDLWGPLFICVALSLMLHSNGHGEAAPQFTQVFSLSFFGAVVVTVNIKMLGGTISFFQSLCVVGYCLLPPTAAAFVCSTLFFEKLFFIRLIITAVGFSWATYAAMGFLSGTVSEKRRMLVVYPIFLFYFIVSWLILSHS